MRGRLLLSALVTASLGGTATAAHAQLPAIHTLGPVLATSAMSLSSVAEVRALPDGRVLVNDVGTRRLILFDTTLQQANIVADSTPSTANAYGGGIGGLLPYVGDSSLFVDPTSMSMLVVDATGKIARMMSVPRWQDANWLAMPGGAGYDPAGRLVYRGMSRPAMPARAPNGGIMPPAFADSAPILRVAIVTRKLDTVTYVKIPKMNVVVSRDDKGRVTVTSVIDPMPVVDDWTLLPDGTTAIVRGRDFHVDFVSPAGTLTSAAKVPYEWQRLGDSAKVAVIDSARAALEAARKAAASQAKPGATASAEEEMDGRILMMLGYGSTARGQMPPLAFVSPSELPDYRPAIVPGSARADLEGNLWVQTTLSIPGHGPVYDVIDHTGKLVGRTQSALGSAIVAFAPGGVVYLVQKHGRTSRLQRVSLK